MCYTREVWSHMCMEGYASWMLCGGSDKADPSDKSSNWLSNCSVRKCQAGCVGERIRFLCLRLFFSPPLAILVHVCRKGTGRGPLSGLAAVLGDYAEMKGMIS